MPRSVAGLWWLSTRRRWQHEVVPALIVGGVAWMHASAMLAAAAGTAALELTLLYVAGLLAALFAPMAFPGSGVLGSVRFDLLPWEARRFFVLRLLFNQPLRTLLAVSAVVWTLIGLARLRLEPAVALAVAVQVLALTAAGVLLAQIVEEALMRRRAIVALNGLSLLGLGALLGLSAWDRLIPELRRAPGFAALADAPLLPGGGGAFAAGAGGAALGAAAAALLLLGAVALGRRVALAHAEPAPPARRTPLMAHAIAAIARRVAPRAPAAFGRDVAFILRHARLASGLLTSFALASAALYFGVPWLFTAALLTWAMLTLNLLGADLPLDGITRYGLLPVPLARVLRRRHAAILLLATVSAAAAAPAVALLGGWRTPVVGPASLAMHPLAHAYGVALYLVGAAIGDRLSVRHPNWYDFHSRRRIGEAMPVIPSVVAMVLFFGLAGALTAAGVVAADVLAADTSRVGGLGVVFVTALLLAVLLYTAASHRLPDAP